MLFSYYAREADMAKFNQASRDGLSNHTLVKITRMYWLYFTKKVLYFLLGLLYNQSLTTPRKMLLLKEIPTYFNQVMVCQQVTGNLVK